jgi:uncharacterized protein (TIGR02118 family)
MTLDEDNKPQSAAHILAWRLGSNIVAHRIVPMRPRKEDTMARLVVMYRTPKDAGAFDKHYFERHVPLAKKIAGIRKYEVSRGPVMTPAGPSGFHLIATLHFDDMAAIKTAFASPEGQAAAADVATFATGGADMIMFDSAEV